MTIDDGAPGGIRPEPVPVDDADGRSPMRTVLMVGTVLVAAVVAIVALVTLADSAGDDTSKLATDSSETTVVDDGTAEGGAVTAPSTPDDASADADADAVVDDGAAAPAATEVAVETAPDDASQNGADAPPPATDTAVYRVTMSIDWTDATHPSTLPRNAHVSPPVIAVHSDPGAMFAVGTPASPGIEAMAERGSTDDLVAELEDSGLASSVSVGDDIPAPAVGERSFDVSVSQSGHLISLVTMLAPSPDWFVGFADLQTFVDGQWIQSTTFDLGNYDAGTDSGSDFASGDAETQPQEPVSGPLDEAFAAAAAQAPFGSVTITKIG